jgi:hypothetical protein
VPSTAQLVFNKGNPAATKATTGSLILNSQDMFQVQTSIKLLENKDGVRMKKRVATLN